MDEDAVIAGRSTKSGEGATAQSQVQKIGWGVLLAISGLLVLNGIMWFGSGAGLTLAYPLRVEGVAVDQFTQEHPVVVDHIGMNAREVAIWYAAFGLMALMVALEGFRRGTRWAWNTSWVMSGVFVVAGLTYGLNLGLGFVNAGRADIGLIALVGLLLARPR